VPTATRRWPPRPSACASACGPGAFLVDGAVAGAWRHERGRIEVKPFRRLDGATQRALRQEADRLATLYE
jgi:Winged helix DNA-binding domain